MSYVREAELIQCRPQLGSAGASVSRGRSRGCPLRLEVRPVRRLAGGLEHASDVGVVPAQHASDVGVVPAQVAARHKGQDLAQLGASARGAAPTAAAARARRRAAIVVRGDAM